MVCGIWYSETNKKIRDMKTVNIPDTTYYILHTRSLGQSLVEVLVAVGIVSLVLVAIVAGVTLAIKNASFSRNQTSATRYAQEAMEWLRNQRDQDWNAFVLRSGPFCLNSLSWKTGTCSSFSLGNIFKREAVLSGSDPRIEVKVTVSWQDAGGTHQSELVSYFTKWQ